MTFVYNGASVYYEIFGEGEPCLLLHGWGCDGTIFKSLVSQMPERKFIVVDFPPFGKSDQSIEEWNIFTYASMIISLCEHLSISKCDILGHSFGGRVAILVSALKLDLVRSCVLVDSAGLKPKRSLKYYFKVCKYKILKKLGFFVTNAGSSDYQNLPEGLRKVFVSIVNHHLDEYCHLIKAPTLIIFGKNDADTPVYMAKKLKKLIKYSTLVLLDDAGHYSFLDSPLVFYKHLQNFWEEL